VVAISGSGVLLLLLGLLLPGVRALICIMPGLSTIVAYAGQKFFRLGHLLLIFWYWKFPEGLFWNEFILHYPDGGDCEDS
jgi:hypothetical protein